MKYLRRGALFLLKFLPCYYAAVASPHGDLVLDDDFLFKRLLRAL